VKKQVIAGIAVSAVFLALALRGIDWGVLWQSLRQTRLDLLALSIAFTFAQNFLRSYRWGFMLLPIKRVSKHELFAVTSIGLMANNLLPARLGEIVRAHVLGRSEGVSRTASFATIVYERVVDVFSVLLLLWLTLLWIDGPAWLKTSSLWLFALNLALFVVFILIDRAPDVFLRWLARLTGRLPERACLRIDSAARAFATGVASVGRKDTFAPIALTTLAILVCVVLSVYYCLGAMAIDLPLAASALMFVLLILGSMIPSAPAYIGTYQYACVIGLGLFGVGRSEALAFSLVYNAAQFFPVTLVGFVYLWRAGLRLSELKQDYQ